METISLKKRLSMLIGIAAIMQPLIARAAPVTWGSWTAVTDNTAIQTLAGYSTYGGVNFNGSTTTINNGAGGSGGTSVVFTGIAQNASGATAGITVGSSGFGFQSTGNNSNVVSAVGSPQAWGTVLDRVIGDFDNSATITLSGLTAGHNYYVQFFSSAPDANIQANSKIASGGVDSPLFGNHVSGGTKTIIATLTADGPSQSFAVTGTEPTYSALVIGVQSGSDTTPPVWIASWPQAAPLSTTSLALRAWTNEAGTAYYVVLPDGSPAPTSAQVKAGTNSSNTPVSASGSMALSSSTEATRIVAGLSPGAAYDAWFVAQDAAGSPNLQASPTKVDTSTLAPDTTPPAWIATWPQAAPLTPTSLNVRVRINEAGTAYYVVLPGGAAAPSAAQVKAGNNSANLPALKIGSLALTANVESTAAVTGLTKDSTCDVYFVAEDAAPNLQAAPSVVSVALSSFASEPFISEFVAAGSTHLDENLTAQDWIEIRNPNDFGIDLAGYCLTDSATNLTKWAFPSTTLAAGGFLVVFASDLNRAVTGSPLHTNFKLSAGGEYLALVKPDGTTVVSSYAPVFPAQIEGFSYGLNASATGGYFAPPTPGAANGLHVPPLPSPILNPPCATFTVSTSVTITERIPGAGNVIRYTTNGSEPTVTSTLYTGAAISISSTTQLRARVFSSEGGAGQIAGGHYQQLATTSNLAGINPPGTFESNLPIMVIENFGAGAIPAVSSTTLQAARLSVYAPPAGNSILTSAPDACYRIGIKRRGNSSRNWAKGQYRFELQDETGGDLNAGLLGLPAESDWVLNGPYPDKSLIRDSLIYDLGSTLGMEAPRTRHIELFLNLDGGDLRSSDYMGVYILVEKIKQDKNRTDITAMTSADNSAPAVTGGYILHSDEPFHITEGGGPKPTNWRSLEIDEPKNPTTAQRDYIGQYMDSFAATLGWARWNGANNAGVINNDPLTGYPAYIDAGSFVNLLTINELTRNQDAYVSSDYMYKDRGGKLHKGPLWDFNLTMGVGCCHNDTSTRFGWMLGLRFCRGGDEHSYEPDFFVPLLRDADFRQQWIDKWFRLRRSGALADAALNARIDSHANPLAAAAVRNFIKWPILGSSEPTPPFRSPVTATWAEQIDFIKDWLGVRMLWVDSQFPDPVDFSPNPGAVAAGAGVTLTATGGTLYYTADGSDPRLAGGAINPAAIAISSGTPVTINATTTLIARTLHNTWATTPSGTAWGVTWSAPTRATFVTGTPASAANLLITEMNYHPAGPATAAELADPTFHNDDFEFIEVKNISGGPIDLGGMAFTGGINHDVLPPQVLAAGEYGVFVESLAAFRARYGNGPRVLGVYSDKLDNGGEAVKLVTAAGATIAGFAYDDLWYPATDGPGFTLVAVNETSAGADLSSPLSWAPGGHLMGTPGMANNSLNFAGWLRENFTALELATPQTSGALADVDLDGITTLMEFALGLDPKVGNAPSLLPSGGIIELAGDDYLMLSFRRLKTANDLRYRAQVSPDLTNWSDLTSVVGTPVDNGDGTETVTMRDPVKANEGMRRFMRLEVEW